MKIHLCQQRSPEWRDIRRGVITASDAAAFCVSPMDVQLTVKQISEELARLGIDHKKNSKREDLLALLPDLTSYQTLNPAAQKLILKKIREGTAGKTDLRDAWEIELAEHTEKKLSYSIPIQRGNQLEPEARAYYESQTGFAVTEIGFAEHDSGGFGCSPDGLIADADGNYLHGLEIKCPMPETHLGYLLAGTLPDDYLYQIHHSMVVTELSRWDFLSYCPGEAQLLITVERSTFTDDLEAGLKQMVAQKAIIKARLAQMWAAGNQPKAA